MACLRPPAIWRSAPDRAVGGVYLSGRSAALSDTTRWQFAATVLKVYISEAFDAAMLIAYFGIFAMKAAGRR
jgi:hypothetical protein